MDPTEVAAKSLKLAPLALRLCGRRAWNAKIQSEFRLLEESFRKHGPEGLLSKIVSAPSNFRSWTRRYRLFRPMGLFSAFLSVLILSYGMVWWLGTLGMLSAAQRTLPWRVYDTDLAGARTLLNQPKSQLSPWARDHLSYWAAHSHATTKWFFCGLNVFMVALILSGTFYLTLWLSHLIAVDIQRAPRRSSLLFTCVGAFVLRNAIETLDAGLILFSGAPTVVIVLVPLLKIARHSPGIGALLISGIFGFFALLSRIAVPVPMAYALHFSTLPIRFLEYVTFTALIVSIFPTITVEVICWLCECLAKVFSEEPT